MDTLQNNFPDEEFYNIQIKLRKWLRRNGFSTWKQIQKTCRTLLEAYPNEYSDLYGKYPEYKLFMPLLSIISRKSGQKIPKIANLQYYKSKANYGTKKKVISRKV